MKTILFFTCEPGGAENLVPVIRLLQERGCDTVVLAYGHGLDRFSRHGVSCIEVGKIQADGSNLLAEYRPDLVITSATSLPTRDMSEKYLWHIANKHNITTVAFLDQWQNYELRFSGPFEGERLKYVPDFINCIDDLAKGEMIRAGFQEHTLVTWGHPYLSTILERFSEIDVNKAKKRVGDWPTETNDGALLFVSEAIFENYGTTRGYNQYDVLEFFLKNVQSAKKPVSIIVKLHPKEDPRSFEKIISGYPDLKVILIGAELSSLECLALCDRVFGMTSIMLIEAYILDKIVVSLQPNLIDEDPLVLSRLNIVPVLKNYSDFDVFGFKESVPNRLSVHFDEQRFLAFIESILSENTVVRSQNRK